MKIAIISVSDKGQKLAVTLKNKLDADSTVIKTDLYHKNVKKYFSILFYEYDAIIAIMASGILIRSIAPLIESKVSDPAILNIDDNGNFVISTLSGHLLPLPLMLTKGWELMFWQEIFTCLSIIQMKFYFSISQF